MENPPPSASPKEPEPKKLKMSITSDDDEDLDININDAAGAGATEREQRYKRRKIAIFFAYCGVGYQGMQKNPGAKTIEGDLEEALFVSGAVPEQDRGKPRRFDWARSARTDKGVSAIGQVVSGRFFIDPPGLVDRLNSNLPSQIRIFGFKRVTGSFSAKKFCDRRRYVYLIPVFALDPCSHPDRESVLASLGSETELVKCLECSERGRKAEGIMGKRIFETRVKTDISAADNSKDVHFEATAERGILSNNGVAEMQSEVKEAAGDSNSDNLDNGSNKGIAEMHSEVKEVARVSSSDNLDNGSNKGIAEMHSEVKEAAGVSSSDNVDNGSNNEMRSEVKEAAGVSNPDNLDNGSNSGIAEMHSEVKEVARVSNSENLDNVADLNEGAISPPELAVEEKKIDGELGMSGNGEEEQEKGSVFCYDEKERERFNRILRQYEGTHNFHNFTTRIKAEDPSAKRYIISFDAKTTVSVQGIEFVKIEVVGQSFMLHQIRKMVGLAVAIMRNCAAESIIETALQKDVNINVPTAPEVGLYLDECFFASYNQKWKYSHEEVSLKAYADEAENFKMNFIYPHIASTEHKEGAVALWLHSLNHRNYPDLRIMSNGGTSDAKTAEPDVLLV